MARYFDESDDDATVRSHAEDGENPQHSPTPQSVQDDALRELRDRGYSPKQVDDIRLRRGKRDDIRLIQPKPPKR